MPEKQRARIQIGKRIKLRREELAISQTELAQRCGYTSKAAISKIETGVNDIPRDKLIAIANALNISTADLIMEDISKRATAYTIAQADMPELKELNTIIKEHYSEDGFVSKLLDYAKLLIK